MEAVLKANKPYVSAYIAPSVGRSYSQPEYEADDQEAALEASKPPVGAGNSYGEWSDAVTHIAT